MTQVIPGIQQRLTPERDELNRPISRIINRTEQFGTAQVGGSILGDGRVVVVYESSPGQTGGVYARIIFPDDTLSPEISVDPSGSNACLAMGIDGTFAVLYHRETGPWGFSKRHVVIRTFNPDGTPKYWWPIEPEIDSARSSFLGRKLWGPASITALYDGKFAVIWLSGYRGLRSARSELRYCTYDPTTRIKSPNVPLQVTDPKSPSFGGAAQITELSPFSPDLMAWVTAAYPPISLRVGVCSKDASFIKVSDSFIQQSSGYQMPGIAPIGVNAASNFAFVVVSVTPNIGKIIFSDFQRSPTLNDPYLWGGLPSHANENWSDPNWNESCLWPAITALNNNKFVIAWTCAYTGGEKLVARVFNQQFHPETGEYIIKLDNIGLPALATTPNGFYVVWTEKDPSLGPDISCVKGQRYVVTN
jgi:hypothetical protein